MKDDAVYKSHKWAHIVPKKAEVVVNTEPLFDLWLEFEEWLPSDGDDPESDFFNMGIRLANGTSYALNVWTFKYLQQVRERSKQIDPNFGGKYLVPPDLLVERLDRKLLEEVVKDLIQNNELKDGWLDNGPQTQDTNQPLK